MNLLTMPWIQVQIRSSDTGQQISLSDVGDKDIVDIIAIRGDFRGAIYQLLIGLLQTAFTPEGRKEWLQFWKMPPTPAELDAAFEPYLQVFDLNAPKGQPAFMQDLELHEGEDKGISALFIEAPGGKTVRDNQDHFIKHGNLERISPWSAAVALFTLQINAPAGGVGHRVSLRGGGPLTTLILPLENQKYNTLWHRLWLNILTKEEIANLPGNKELKELGAIFPWMVPTRTSEKKGLETYPEHAHPLQAYWSMPRRIRLHWLDEQGLCDLTEEQAASLVNGFYTKNYGANYAGNWVHPLTPYVFEDSKEPLSIKAQPGGLGYRHWLGMVVEEKKGKLRRSPATIVQVYKDRWDWISDIDEADFNPRLWAFGYDMDNMKARCWYEAEMPIFNLEQDKRDDIADYAEDMIHAATDVLKTLKSALKKAWFKRPKDAKGDMSFIDANFWSATEPAFYTLLQELVANLEDRDKANALLNRWRQTLTDQAHSLFDQYALSNLNEDGDFKRLIKARHGKGGLEHYLNGSKALKKLAA